MKTSLLLVISMLMIIGCRTGQQYSYRDEPVIIKMQSMIGKSKEEVVLAVGVPSGEKTIGSLDILMYCIGCSIDSASESSAYIIPGTIIGSAYGSSTSKTKMTYEQLINYFFQNNKLIGCSTCYSDGTIFKVELKKGITYSQVLWNDDILESWDNSQKKRYPIATSELKKHTGNAIIADVPIAVRNEVLKEMSMDDLKEVIRDMDKDAARRLTVESIRAIYNFNQSMRKK